MIRLHPLPDCKRACPYDDEPMLSSGWYMPGMRTLADLRCPVCAREFLGDLPVGHGLYYPMLLEKSNGQIHNAMKVAWFADWLKDSYSSRSNQAFGFLVESFHSVERPVLLNCLDRLYGHSLLKLLNAQHYINNKSGFDLITLVPRCLRWLVPEGVAEIWTVDLPLSQGSVWSDYLADAIAKQVTRFPECFLSIARPHPKLDEFDIQRFTGVPPFPIDQFAARLCRPIITFAWREDRQWMLTAAPEVSTFGKLKKRFFAHAQEASAPLKRMVRLAELVRAKVPNIDWAVTGLGQPGGLPSWIHDLRMPSLTVEQERMLCRRYAESHIVIGVHGSNMILPSAHAACTIELVPEDRWTNLVQDLLPNVTDARESLLRVRLLPLDVDEFKVSELIFFMLQALATNLFLFQTQALEPGTSLTQDQIDAILIQYRNLSSAGEKLGPVD